VKDLNLISHSNLHYFAWFSYYFVCEIHPKSSKI